MLRRRLGAPHRAYGSYGVREECPRNDPRQRMQTRTGLTDLLALAAAGDRDALDRAYALVYGELRRLAHRQLRRENAGHTLSTTALVHEAYLRLVDQTRGGWHDRTQFLGVAATAMRRVLVDHARRHRAAKRGAARLPTPLESVEQLAGEDRAEFLVLLDDALDRLATLDPRQARVVECRFFGGYTEEETADALGIGLRTAKRDWAKARSWLFQELYPDAIVPRLAAGSVPATRRGTT
jgi:RNA polymerase sigma-70 factor, ECF subfamily